MNNAFVDSLLSYKEKCDKYIEGGNLKCFMSRFALDDVMGKYIDALVNHSAGGKRIRAYLVALGYGIFKGLDKVDDVLEEAISYELFQTGILAHDDIIDKSDYRRFKPSMHKDLGEGHDGVSKSICVGDLGIVAAIEIIQQSKCSDEIKLKAISHQNRVFASTIAGELKDIEFETSKDVSEDDVMTMYLLKTAQYTVSGPLELGAVLADADETRKKALVVFGDCVGIAFQIRDDILGMYGDEKKLGKSVVSDMCEGKKTVLYCHFNENATDLQKQEMSTVYGRADSGVNELEIARKLFDEAGSLEYAQDKCRYYTEKAKEYIDLITDKAENKILLSGLLDYMTSRQA